MKIQHIIELINFNYVHKKPTIYKTFFSIKDGIEFITCNKCNVSKQATNFNKNKSMGCKECIQIADKYRNINPRSSLLYILKNARATTKNETLIILEIMTLILTLNI
jgi:hypothetical protein